MLLRGVAHSSALALCTPGDGIREFLEGYLFKPKKLRRLKDSPSPIDIIRKNSKVVKYTITTNSRSAGGVAHKFKMGKRAPKRRPHGTQKRTSMVEELYTSTEYPWRI